MKAVPLNRYCVFFLLAIVGCLADLGSKRWVFDRLQAVPGGTEWLWPGRLALQCSLNTGALWGVGQGMVSVFAVLSLLAIVGILIWLFYAGAARNWILTIALGCVTAGIFGNLYDRLGLHGLTWGFNCPPSQVPGARAYAVRDWILVMFGNWGWPNFNLADSLLVCGAILLLGHALFLEKACAADKKACCRDEAAAVEKSKA